MTRFIILLLIFSYIFIPGCTESAKERHYKYVGQASFRRSYAGHENWSEAQLDSAEKSNPFYLFSSDSSANHVLAILNRLGIGNKDELLLNKIEQDLKDTITIVNNHADFDTICITYDIPHTRSSIQIKNKQSIDSIPIKDEAFSHTFNLVRLKDNSNPFIVFVNQYYIMNGDNYEISVYEKK
jgi:hypothetical protein